MKDKNKNFIIQNSLFDRCANLKLANKNSDFLSKSAEFKSGFKKFIAKYLTPANEQAPLLWPY